MVLAKGMIPRRMIRIAETSLMVATADNTTAEDTTAFTHGERGRTVVAGHYEIDLDAPLGAGGMALVYRGRDLRTRRIVALKTLRLEYRRDPESRARFRREARTMAFLHHPNVARVYDLYEDKEAPWVVLEYVPGRSLKEVVQERGPLGLEDIAHILDQIASALGHLHRRGLVHLDVKPQNLILNPGGTVKLIDFGLAQRAGEPQEMIGGLAFGTAAYLAPEQACGEPVAAATDVYALGCVVYELLTGRPPFEADGEGEAKNDVIRAHLERTPAPPSRVRPDLNLPSWVDDVVLWALAKRPEDRYSDVTSFARLFRSGVEGTLAAAEATTTRLPPIPVVEARRIVPAPAPRHPLGSRLAAGAYRAAGRRLRRARGLRRTLWRLTAAVAIANLILALLLLYDRGAVPGLIAGGTTVQPGVTAQVTVDRLNFRSAPGLFTVTLAQLEAGDRVVVTGAAVIADGETWWPVTIERGGYWLDGYVWDGGIKPAGDGKPAWLTWLLDQLRRVAPARLSLPPPAR